MDVRVEPTSTVMVYLFAGQLVPPAKGVLTMGAPDPRGEAKLELKPLVVKAYTAAFMDLVERGYIRLAPVQVKKFLGKETAVVPEVLTAPGPAPAGLAGVLLQAIQQAQKPEQRRVREVVIRVVGGRGSSNYPWWVALTPVIAEASSAGYVTRPEKKPGLLKAMFNPADSLAKSTAVSERVDPLQAGLPALQARLQAFERGLGDLAALLRKEIENGVNDCKDNSSE